MTNYQSVHNLPSNTITRENNEDTFNGLGIEPKILEVLRQLKFSSPTPIQKRAIPIAVGGQDVVGIAQTGTGKTLAFGIPMIQQLVPNNSRGLVILPTRELALQVNDSLQKLGSRLGLKTAVLIGGASMGQQRSDLSKQPHIIVATPGRLIDHLQQRSVRLDKLEILVLDEADRMLDMGFAPQIKQILRNVPTQRQTMLFSATMPQEIVQIATSYMRMPVRVEVAPAGTMAERVTHELFFVNKEDKQRLLESILYQYKGSILVFSRTKYGAQKITRVVSSLGHRVAEIHSERTLNQRVEALNGFKTGKYRILIATDIAARGIDVKEIELVINYDLPDKADDYLHRIGRTGRAGNEGHAISFATPDQKRDVKDIERLMKKTMPVSSLPITSTREIVEPKPYSVFRGGPRRGR